MVMVSNSEEFSLNRPILCSTVIVFVLPFPADLLFRTFITTDLRGL
jgi:hypothetical protein